MILLGCVWILLQLCYQSAQGQSDLRAGQQCDPLESPDRIRPLGVADRYLLHHHICLGLCLRESYSSTFEICELISHTCRLNSRQETSGQLSYRTGV